MTSLTRSLLAVLLLCLVALTMEARNAGKLRESNRVLTRYGLEEIASRVRTTAENLVAAKGRDAVKPEEIAREIAVPVGRTLEILPRKGLPVVRRGFMVETDKSGRRIETIESDCGDYRIRLSREADESWLAGDNVFSLLVVACLILLTLLFFTAHDMKSAVRRDMGTLRAMFGGRFKSRGAFRRALRNPVTLACAIAFLFAVGITWVMMSQVSMREARAQLLAAAHDMRDSVNTCADNLLFYQGNAIVNHYKAPEAMTLDTVQVLMKRYGIDELNVVNAKGIVIAGALADVGYDMAMNPNSAKFNCLLYGIKTYSQDFRAPIENPNGPKRKYAGVAFPWPVKGYIQMGFGEDHLKNGIDFWFEEAAIDRHIGKRGYYIISDCETGNIKSCGRRDPKTGEMTMRRGLTLAQVGIDVSALPEDNEEFFTMRIVGETCLCLHDTRCFHRILTVLPMSEIHGGGTRIVLMSAAILLAVFVIVVFFMTKLTDLVISLREKERAERERQEKDLSVAKTIQFSSLPVIFPNNENFRIFAQMDPAREVGGDFYDFYTLPSGRLFVLIADVSGKGVPAAMFMMKAKSTIKASLFDTDNLADAVAEANDRLADNNDANMFITAWFGSYDLETGELEYVNAGHNPPIVRRSNGAIEWIRGKRSLVLAAMGGASYRIERLTLNAGDSLLLYTDGVTEAMNAAGELYGEPRLEDAMRRAGDLFVTEVRADVDKFVNGAEQSDDITMLAFDVKKHKKKETEK